MLLAWKRRLENVGLGHCRYRHYQRRARILHLPAAAPTADQRSAQRLLYRPAPDQRSTRCCSALGSHIPAALLECQNDPADTLGTCVAPKPNPFCAALMNQHCVGGEQARNFPYCSMGCDFAFAAKDSTVELKSTLFETPIAFTPIFYPVTYTRVMTRQTQPCTVADPETGDLQCVWHEADPSAATWDETFSPKLFVSAVLAFVLPNGDDPNDSRQRRYITLDRVELGLPPVNYHCGPNQVAPTQVDADGCPRRSAKRLPATSRLSRISLRHGW